MTIDITLDAFMNFITIATQVGWLIFILVLILVGLRVLRLLGVITEITEAVQEMIELVNLALWKPITLYNKGMAFVKKFLGK